MKTFTKLFVFIPVLFIALFVKPAKAEVLGEWTYSQSNNCGGSVEVVDNSITLHGPDNGNEFWQCGGQAHWVKIETTIPTNVSTIYFDWSYQTNDGAYYDPPQYGINGVYTTLGNWYQQNQNGTKSVPVNQGDIFSFRQYSVDTCCQPGNLTISNLSLWNGLTNFSSNALTTTTTFTTELSTTTTTTTLPSNPETTTSIYPSTTAEQITQSTMAENTVSTTTTSLPPSTTTTVLVPTGTTTTIAEILPTEIPPATEPQTTTTETTETDPPLVETSVETVPTPKTTTTLENLIINTVAEETTTTTTLPPDALGSDLSVVEAQQLLDTAETPEALKNAIETLVKADAPINGEQVIAILNNPVFAELPSNQIEQVFQQLDITALDETQVEQLTEQLNTAPENVKTAFENAINIFSGVFNNYVPTGSTIPVHARRTLVAAGAVISFLPAPQPKTRRKK